MAARSRATRGADRLADGDELSARALREELPALSGRVRVGADTKWAADVSIAPRVLTQLGADARIVRGRNAQPLAGLAAAVDLDVGLAGGGPRAARRGGGLCRARTALAAHLRARHRDRHRVVAGLRPSPRSAGRWPTLGAVTVSLDSGDTGWLLPDDLEPEPPVEPWAALLPVLDPTLMGWKQRDFYLDADHTPYLFDTNGNGGTTAWWNGRVVGCWVQDPDAVVRVVLREDVGTRRHGCPVAGGRAAHGMAGRRDRQQRLRVAADARGEAAVRDRLTGCPEEALACAATWHARTHPSNRPRCSDCACATPSVVASASPATATSAARSSGRSSGPASRWPTRPASTRTRGSPTRERRRPVRRARRSTSRSRWPPVLVPSEVHALLDEALPPGLDIIEVVESPGGSLADRLEASRWRIDVSAPLDGARAAVDAFLASDEVLVERMTKKGLREFDARGAVLSLSAGASTEREGAAFDLVLRHGVPAVRPDDVLGALSAVSGTPMGEAPSDHQARPGSPRRVRRDRRPARLTPRLPSAGQTRVGSPARSRSECAILATFDADGPPSTTSRRRSRRAPSRSGTSDEGCHQFRDAAVHQ